jgi:hypothetical protein
MATDLGGVIATVEGEGAAAVIRLRQRYSTESLTFSLYELDALVALAEAAGWKRAPSATAPNTPAKVETAAKPAYSAEGWKPLRPGPQADGLQASFAEGRKGR